MKTTNRSLVPFALIESLKCLDNIYEARLFSWIIAKAQSVLKYYNKELGSINIQFALDMARVILPAKMLLAPGDDNYKEIPKAFSLANKTVDYISESGNVYHLNIIAFPEYIKNPNGTSYVTFVIHNQLWHAILDNFKKGYRVVNLLDIFHLTSKYSVILYYLLSQQRQFRVGVDVLRQLMGAPDSYRKWNNFENRILRSSIKDIHEHTNCRVEYTKEINDEMRGKPVTTLTFSFYTQKNDPDAERLEKCEELRSMLSDEVVSELERMFEIKPSEVGRFEAKLLQLGSSGQQLSYLDKVAETARRGGVANKAGYLYTSLKNREVRL